MRKIGAATCLAAIILISAHTINTVSSTQRWDVLVVLLLGALAGFLTGYHTTNLFTPNPKRRNKQEIQP